MRKMQIRAAVCAAMLAAGLSGCGGYYYGGGSSAPVAEQAATGEPVETSAVTEETAAETTAPAEEPAPEITEAPETETPADDPAAAFSGKWVVAEENDIDREYGQYGAEEYRRIYQMELREDHTYVFYMRTDAQEYTGRWEAPDDSTVRIIFDDGKDYYPAFAFENRTTDWKLQNGRLCYQDSYTAYELEQVVEFPEREFPESAWLAGDWHAIELSDSSGNRLAEQPDGTPVGNIRVSIFTVQDTTGMHITMTGDTVDGDLYFAQLQPDGSFLALQEFEDGSLPQLRDTVFRAEGGQIIWKINSGGLGTLVLARAGS